MSKEAVKIPFKHTLAFIAIASFLVSFFGSRLFATVCPTCVVVGSGIHFHHFWYGIGMVALTGWLAIVGKRTDRLDRAYALVYGLGLGLIGDEVGLLLTFGNYYSELTYQIFRWSNWPDYSRSLGYSIRRESAKGFHANGAMGRSGPCRALSSRVLNRLFRVRSRHYRIIFRFARAPSNCLGLPASARDVCSDYEGLTPSESWL